MFAHLRGAADIVNGPVVARAFRQRLLIQGRRSGKVERVWLGGDSGGGCAGGCAVGGHRIRAAVWLVVHTAHDAYKVDDGNLRAQQLREQGHGTVAAEQVIARAGPWRERGEGRGWGRRGDGRRGVRHGDNGGVGYRRRRRRRRRGRRRNGNHRRS